MLASNTSPKEKTFPMRRGTIFQGENQQPRGLNWLGGQLFLRRRGLHCPKEQLHPMNKEISLRAKGFFSRRKKQNGSTNHVPLNNNFLGEKAFNFF
jgi:hypothetical protein